MKNNKIVWGLVSLLVLITIGVTVGKTNNFSQQDAAKISCEVNAANIAYKQLQEKQKDYPVADYNAPESTDIKEREKKQKKNNRYDRKPIVLKRVTPTDDTVTISGLERVPPAIPTAESSLIVIGKTLNGKASVSNNKEGLYSEFDLEIEKILKDNPQKGFQLGNTITIDRIGGYLRYPNGQKVLYKTDWQDLPETNKRYIFFLENPDESLNYRIITGYKILNGNIFALDNVLPFKNINGTSEIDFVSLVLNNLNTSIPFIKK